MFTGADGSGKTASALMVAKGLIQAKYPDMDDASQEFWDKIGMLDTEHSRGKIYADTTLNGHYIGKFLHIDFEPPYDVDSYISGIDHLKAQGCEIGIVDSLSHAWNDTGGLLELHGKMGGTFQTWNKVNPIITKFYRAVTADRDIHVIASVRSKISYGASTSETGKMEVTKIGLKPIMRDNFEYEVLSTVHFNMEHKATVLKDITHIIPNGVYIEPIVGRDLHAFLEQGVDMGAVKAEERAMVTEEVLGLLEKGQDPKFKKPVDALMFTVKRQSKAKYGTEDWTMLPTASLYSVKENLEGIVNDKK